MILANWTFDGIIARMIERNTLPRILDSLAQFPAVVLLGPRQVGKTTLAESIAAGRDCVYLDLENPGDRGKLADVEQYLGQHEGRLVILDEVHRAPELFGTLRGLIDRGRRKGVRAGRFLLLGSASMDLLRQTSESLAGRVAYVELPPLRVPEVGRGQRDQLWVRGGFPDSFLAESDRHSLVWREYFIKTYLERDIPGFGLRVPAESLRRFWTMLAHNQGGLLNASRMAQGLAISGKTVSRHLDLMVDLLLARRLQPYHVNVKKRLVKSPKVYVRDSGLLHTLLGVHDREALFGHPVVGASWEGFVIDSLLSVKGEGVLASFYRTAAGAEIDLVLEFPGLSEKWAIEVKTGLAPKPGKGFYNALEDVGPTKAFVVYAGDERYHLAAGVEAIGLADMCGMLACAAAS